MHLLQSICLHKATSNDLFIIKIFFGRDVVKPADCNKLIKAALLHNMFRKRSEIIYQFNRLIFFSRQEKIRSSSKKKKTFGL